MNIEPIIELLNETPSPLSEQDLSSFVASVLSEFNEPVDFLNHDINAFMPLGPDILARVLADVLCGINEQDEKLVQMNKALDGLKSTDKEIQLKFATAVMLSGKDQDLARRFLARTFRDKPKLKKGVTIPPKFFKHFREQMVGTGSPPLVSISLEGGIANEIPLIWEYGIYAAFGIDSSDEFDADPLIQAKIFKWAMSYTRKPVLDERALLRVVAAISKWPLTMFEEAKSSFLFLPDNSLSFLPEPIRTLLYEAYKADDNKALRPVEVADDELSASGLLEKIESQLGKVKERLDEDSKGFKAEVKAFTKRIGELDDKVNHLEKVKERKSDKADRLSHELALEKVKVETLEDDLKSSRRELSRVTNEFKKLEEKKQVVLEKHGQEVEKLSQRITDETSYELKGLQERLSRELTSDYKELKHVFSIDAQELTPQNLRILKHQIDRIFKKLSKEGIVPRGDEK